jgi:peptide/nickel transport system substrate-binding protein
MQRLLQFTILLCLATGPIQAAERSLRVGIPAFPPSLGNPYTATGLPSANIWDHLFDGLTVLGTDGLPAPSLALAWELEAPTRWVFQLRRDVRYANGKPFDAAAAKRVFDWLLSEQGRATLIGNELRSLVRVSVRGRYGLVLETRQPDPILPNRLIAVLMVEPDSWDGLGIKGFALQPIGTGSYLLETWQNAGGAAVLVANPYAWEPPRIKRVEIYYLADHATRLQAALSRQLDMVGNMRPEQLSYLRDRGYEVLIDPGKQILGIGFDTIGQPASPFRDRRVRQAINLAVDRETIARVITNGTTRPAGQGASPTTFGYNPDVEPYPYDPARARALLAEAGYPDGFAFTAQVVIGTYANDVEIYQRVQQDLAAVGVRVTIQSSIFVDWLRQYIANEWRSEAFSLAWNSLPYNDAMRPMEYFSCAKSFPFFCTEALRKDLGAAAVELDRDRREQMLKDLQRVFHDEAPCLFLLEMGHIWVYSKQLTGFAMNNRVPRLADIGFTRLDTPD